jgi:hypothetical protein
MRRAARRYMPLLPTVLINGAEGIGTGWSTSIPNYNPRDIMANLRCAVMRAWPSLAKQPVLHASASGLQYALAEGRMGSRRPARAIALRWCT